MRNVLLEAIPQRAIRHRRARSCGQRLRFLDANERLGGRRRAAVALMETAAGTLSVQAAARRA